jgi:hypothetical protein
VAAMLTDGWFRLFRGSFFHSDFKAEKFTQREAWLWSVEAAAFVPHMQPFNGTHYKVERGEFVTSLDDLARKFGWGQKRVRNFIDRMVECGRWAKRGAFASPTASTVIIIRNYEEMQFPIDGWEPASDTAKGKARAKQGQSKGEEHKERKKRGMKGKESASSSDPEIPAKKIEKAVIERWNRTAHVCGWTVIVSVTDVQRRRIGHLIAKFGFARWDEAVMKAGNSELFGGREPPAWFTFDFLLRPEKFNKLMKGDYDKRY